MDAILAKVTAASKALQAAVTVDVVLDLRDLAATAAHYLRQIHATRGAQNDAVELRLRCERRLGELIVANPDYGRGKKSVTVTDFGLNHSEAKRYKHLACIPLAVFERHIATVKESDEDLTARGFELIWTKARKLGTEAVEEEPATPPPPPSPPAPDWHTLPAAELPGFPAGAGRILRLAGVTTAGQLAEKLDRGDLVLLDAADRQALREAVAEKRGYDRPPDPPATPDDAAAALDRAAWTIDLKRVRDKAGDLRDEFDKLFRSPFSDELDRWPLLAAVAAQLPALFDALNDARTWSMKPPATVSGGEPWNATG